jgi:hypothetical protein
VTAAQAAQVLLAETTLACLALLAAAQVLLAETTLAYPVPLMAELATALVATLKAQTHASTSRLV